MGEWSIEWWQIPFVILIVLGVGAATLRCLYHNGENDA